jgi:GT2 family glycosyltransferase
MLVAAPEKRSSYHARNVGASRARSPWLLFLDADCRPAPSLLDDYFKEATAERCGIVAGEVDGDPSAAGVAARHAIARRHLAAEPYLSRGPAPAGATANLLVRRETWQELGGFREVISGADFEFCWRAADAGWKLAYRPGARVTHVHPERLGEALRKARRYGAGQRWANRAHPGAVPRPPLLRELGRAIAGVVVWTLTLRFERAAFKAIDGLWALAYAWGYYLGRNEPAAAR